MIRPERSGDRDAIADVVAGHLELSQKPGL
jgi:hypothetical protein